MNSSRLKVCPKCTRVRSLEAFFQRDDDDSHAEVCLDCDQESLHEWTTRFMAENAELMQALADYDAGGSDE